MTEACMQTEWYLEQLRQLVRQVTEQYQDGLPADEQLHLLRELIIRFDANKNQNDKHVLNEEQLHEFTELAGEVLQQIDDEWLISGTKIWKGYGLSFALQEKFLHLKYKDLKEEYYLTDPKEAGKEQKYPVRIRIQGRELPNQILPRVCLDVVNETKDALVLDCSCPYFLKGPEVRWEVLWNHQMISYQETQRYNDTLYFGVDDYRGYTFRIILKKKDFKEKNTLQFTLNVNGKRIPHPIITRRFTSRIASQLNGSYWCFDRYVITFNKGTVKKTIRIEKCSGLGHLKRELVFWEDILK